MARRKQEVQLQREIETQEEWEDVLSKDGLFVVDVYQEWCGPTAGMVGNFRRIKNEIGDDLLKFAIAKSDTIDALEKYRGRCEPCFLFYAGGVLVAVVRGANAPLILRTITEQLAQEHKVIDGNAERKEIKDPLILQLEEMERRGEQAEEEEEEEAGRKMKFKGEIIDFGDSLEAAEEQKEVTVCIIKPDAVAAGRTEEIIEDLQAHGIEVLRSEERMLTEDEVKNIYTHLQDEEYFDDLVKFMTSGPSSVLALTKGKTGENVIQEFRDLIGPTAVEEAKAQKPESLRSKYGSESFKNALHGSDSKETAMRELAFFFPDFVAPSVEGKAKLQRTLALVRPDAFRLHRDEILGKIREAGFKVAMQKEVNLTKEQAEEFYKEHTGQEYFEELTTRMSSGPLLALGLAREDAIAGWRQMLGPTKVDEAKEQAPDSLRAQFALDDVAINQLHGSDSEETAKKELEFFFPMEQTVAAIKPDAYGTKDEIIDKIHDAGFRIAARKETTLSREIAEEFYADHKDKEYYNDLVEHMVSGPTLFMVLSREAAVDGWRSIIGPTDPQKAKEEEPESLRGLFGSDILKNAVHGSSNPEHAHQSIQKIFGELYFNKDGTVAADEEEQEAISRASSKAMTESKDSKATPDSQDAAQTPEIVIEETPVETKPEGEQVVPGETKPEGEQAPEEVKPEGEQTPAESKPEGEQAQEEVKMEGEHEQEEVKTEGEHEQEEVKPEGKQSTAEVKPAGEETPAESKLVGEQAPAESKQEEQTPTEMKPEGEQEQAEVKPDKPEGEQAQADVKPDKIEGEQTQADVKPDKIEGEQVQADVKSDKLEGEQVQADVKPDKPEGEEAQADVKLEGEQTSADAKPEGEQAPSDAKAEEQAPVEVKQEEEQKAPTEEPVAPVEEPAAEGDKTGTTQKSEPVESEQTAAPEPVQEERREQVSDVAPEYGHQLREEEGEQAEDKPEPAQEGGEQEPEAQPTKEEDTRPPSAKKPKEEEEAPQEPAQEESKAEEQEPQPEPEPEPKPQEEETKEEAKEEAKPAEDQLPDQQQEDSKPEEAKSEEQKPSTPEAGAGDDQKQEEKPSEESPAGDEQAQEVEAEKKSEGAPAEGEAAQGEEEKKGEGDEAQSEQKTEEAEQEKKEEEKKPDEEQTT